MGNKNAKNSILPKLKKNIKEFLNSEDGKISKQSIIKAGVALVVLGAMFEPGVSSAQTCHSSHSSHGSHSSHASGGGWCY